MGTLSFIVVAFCFFVQDARCRFVQKYKRVKNAARVLELWPPSSDLDSPAGSAELSAYIHACHDEMPA